MRRPTHNTTGLPRALREELGIEDKYKPGPSKLNKRSSRGELSRKDRRKAERSHKKDTWSRNEGQEVSQNSRHDNVKPRPGRSARAEEQPKSILKKRKYPEESELGQDDESDFEIDLDESDDEEMQDEDTDKDSQPVASRVPRAVQEKLAEDDAEIAALEKKLGLKGKKKLPKTFQEDGLADLLGDLGSDSETEDKKRKREGDEWLQRKRQKAQMDLGNSEEESEDSEDSEDIDMNEDDTDNMSEDFDEENDEDPSDDAESDFEGFDDEEKEEDPTVQKTKQRENPYRAPISTSEVASAKYIPPSKRLQLSTESESTLRLRRQVQGHLNKLSEANLISILGDIEKLYQDYSRQSVTSMLIELLLGMMCCGSSLNDTFVILQAGFIAAVYKVIGMEFGAEFVQNIVERLDTMYEREDKDDAARKDMTNLISLLSHLYNFHVIGCSLMFDYIRLFLSKINEVNTELLLKVVRSELCSYPRFMFRC